MNMMRKSRKHTGALDFTFAEAGFKCGAHANTTLTTCFKYIVNAIVMHKGYIAHANATIMRHPFIRHIGTKFFVLISDHYLFSECCYFQ